MQFAARRSASATLAVLTLVLSPVWAAAERATEPIEIHVDLTRAPQRIMHARLVMPVEPGPLTLLYPKYLPGEHGPTGPIADLAGLAITVDGERIPWNRDSRDVFTFYVDVPTGVRQLEIELDYLPPRSTGMFGNGPATSDQVAVMSWNTLLFYPAGISIHDLIYRPSLQLPAQWQYGSALRVKKRRRDRVQFEDVSLAELIDSPVATGAHYRQIDLTGNAAVAHRLHLSADSDAPLGGLDNAGWRLVYTAEPNLVQTDHDETDETLDLRFSLGLLIGTENGRLLDVLPGSPAAASELAPGSELIAVNGRRWSSEVLRRAIIEAATGDEPIRLIVENSEFYREVKLDYDGGGRYPHLERVEQHADLLTPILAPQTP